MEVESDGGDIIAIYNFVHTFSDPPGPVTSALLQALDTAQAHAVAGMRPVVLRVIDSEAQALADWLTGRATAQANSTNPADQQAAGSFDRVARAIYRKLGRATVIGSDA